jgi:DNA invertase Pin-like site-specific DNA recombinase
LSKVVLTILAAVAEGERDVIRQRAKADKRKRGLYLGGVVPFGYRRGESGELVPHGGEQGAIEDIRVLRAQGEPLRAISAALAAKGFKLSHEGVARVLRTREAA